MREKSKFYERVERRPRPESYRQRAAIAEEKIEDLKDEKQELLERIAELENRALRERNAELERQLEVLRSRRRRRRRNNPPRE